MVNNIVYFGRIIATILLIRLISLIRLIASLPHYQSPLLHSPFPSGEGRGEAFLLSATLAPLSRHSCPLPVPKVLADLRDLRDPFPLGRTVCFSNPVQR